MMTHKRLISNPTPFPNAEQFIFKEKFIERYSKLTNFEEFKKYSLSFPRKAIRVNTLKKSVEEIKSNMQKNWNLEPVPWCDEGFWISGERRDIGNTVEHVLGYVYVQDAASMIPPVVLNPKRGEIILDMCAAPGSKTTQIAQYMNNEGLLVANDLSGMRLKALGLNLQRMGVANTLITLMRGSGMRNVEFDRVLVDAPCSATGTIRKSPKTINMWNPNAIKKLCNEQRSLLRNGFNLLKPKGTLVYSTCTLEPEENEGAVDWLLKQFDNVKVKSINLDIKMSHAVTEFEGTQYSDEVKKCLRIWPQDNDTEGFFVAKIVKE